MDHRISFRGFVSAAEPPLHAISLLGVVLVLLMSGCAGTPTPVEERPSPAVPEAHPEPPGEPLAEIAYIGPDGNIHTADRHGRIRLRVTDRPAPSEEANLRYGAPRWSRGGEALAFLSFARGPAGSRSGLHAVSADGETSRTLVDRTRVAPLYPAWSPGAEILGFVGAEPGSSELDLRVVRGRTTDEPEPAAPRTVVRGRPLYWQFCGEERILAHVDGIRRYGGRVALFDAGTEGGTDDARPTPPRIIEDDPTPFRTPACSPDGGDALVAADEGRLLAVDLETGEKTEIARAEGRVAFSYSPDGRYIAYTDGLLTRFGGIRGQLSLVRVREDGFDRPRIVEDAPSVLAFFWSPDGSRLAYLQPAMDGEGSVELLVALTVHDLAAGTSETVGPLQLTPLFANEVVYRFDQFARGSTRWAGDGSALALGLMDPAGRPAIYVIPMPETGRPPRRVAAGDLPVWQPGSGGPAGGRIARVGACSFGIDICMFR